MPRQLVNQCGQVLVDRGLGFLGTDVPPYKGFCPTGKTPTKIGNRVECCKWDGAHGEWDCTLPDMSDEVLEPTFKDAARRRIAPAPPAPPRRAPITFRPMMLTELAGGCCGR